MKLEFLIDGEPRAADAEWAAGKLTVREGPAGLEAEVRTLSANELLFRLPDRSVRVRLSRDGDRLFIGVAGRAFVVTEPPPAEAGDRGPDERTAAGMFAARSPMPGKVIKLCVRPGEAVRKNQTLAIVEAMKMENEIQSPAEGTVRAIHAAVGELVDSEKALMDIEASRRAGTER